MNDILKIMVVCALLNVLVTFTQAFIFRKDFEQCKNLGGYYVLSAQKCFDAEVIIDLKEK
jgi:hypothetical protein